MGARNDKEPRVRIYREWLEMIEPLRSGGDERRWLEFFNAATGYALGSMDGPDFQDSELSALWNETRIRRYEPGKIGIIKKARKGGGHGK